MLYLDSEEKAFLSQLGLCRMRKTSSRPSGAAETCPKAGAQSSPGEAPNGNLASWIQVLGAYIFLSALFCYCRDVFHYCTRRALATRIRAAGGRIGSAIYPISFRSLQPEIGFPWTTSIIAFIALGTLDVSIAVMKPWFPPPTKIRAVLDVNALRSLLFVLFSVGLFLSFEGQYIPIFYIVVYTQRHGNVHSPPTFAQ